MINQRYYQVHAFMDPEEAEVAHQRRVAFLDRRAARRGADGSGIAAMLAAAAPPESMGAAPVAPARGAMHLAKEVCILPGSDATYVRGHDPRLRLLGQFWRATDPLTVLCRAAAIRHAESKSEAPFVPPYSYGQIAIARHYQHLVERHDAGGVKLSSLEAGREGGGGGDFMDARLALSRELDRLHRAIGIGSAMVVRRIRPSERGSRSSITDRRLVDMVCLGGVTFRAVLEAHGWAQKGDHIKALQVALRAALDRMQGYPQKGA